jgi:hypothetical protein
MALTVNDIHYIARKEQEASEARQRSLKLKDEIADRDLTIEVLELANQINQHKNKKLQRRMCNG